MTDKIIPKILNGNKQLIIAETVSFFPKEGLKVVIPAVNQFNGVKSELTLKFSFINKDGEIPSLKQSVENNVLLLTCINFNDPLGIGTTTPLPFTFGGSQYSILFIVKALINKENSEYIVYTMTFSIYSETSPK